MARVLVVISGLTGIHNASLELMSRLKSDGHEVGIAMPRQDLKTTNDAFEYHRLQPLYQKSIVRIREDQNKRGVKGLLLRHWHKKSRTKSALDKIEPKDFIPLLDRLNPDLVIVDIEMHEYIYQAYAHESNLLLLCQFFSIWTNADLPSITSTYSVSQNEIWVNLRNRLHFLLVTFKRNKANLLASLFSGGLNRRRILKQLALKYNFPSKNIGRNLWPGYILYSELPVLSMTMESLDFPHKKRRNLHYVGPMVNLDRLDKPASPTDQYSLDDAFLWSKNKQRKLIYCSLSTLQKGDGLFVLKVIKAISQMDSWAMILSLGKAYEAYNLHDFAENIFAFKFVPQMKVLEHAQISINHGGIHVINECIALNVPMLVYSGKKADQNGNAARLNWHKIAYIGDKDIDTEDTIRHKIESLYEDQEIQRNLKATQSAYKEIIESAHFEKLINAHSSSIKRS